MSSNRPSPCAAGVTESGLGRRDEHAGADADLDLALDLEGDQRLAHRGPRDTHLQSEIALRRQAAALA